MVTGEYILEQVWAALRDVTTHRTGFTLGYLGTIGASGEPRVRAIILRNFQRSPERLQFATNANAPKVSEILRNPQVALTMYDADQSIQLRLEGRANIVEDHQERKRSWDTLAPHSQQLYASPLVPGGAAASSAKYY